MWKRKIKLLICAVLVVTLCENLFSSVALATQDRKGYFSKNYSLSGNGADDIVAVARAQVGKTGSQLGYSEQWCADFVSDCADLAGQGAAVPRDGYCPNLRTKIVNAGGYYVTKATAKKGDIVFYGNNGADHVEIVYAASGGNVSTIGGNSGSGSSLYSRQVRDHATQTQSIAYIVRPNYTVSSAPTNPTISMSQAWYDLGDTISVQAHADGATSYYMSMFKDDVKIKEQSVPGGNFTMAASEYGTGKYSCYFSCSNSAGAVDTKWLDIPVVGTPAYSAVYTSSWWYDLTDTVSISVDTICAKGQVIGIDKEGVGRVVTEDVKVPCQIKASNLGVGKYTAYFSVYNGSGGIDTERVSFEIVNMPKEGAVVSTPKTSYSLSDEIEVSVLVYCSKEQWIGINNSDGKRVVTAKADNGKYKIPASELGPGKYTAYFSVSNGSGQYDTPAVEFAVDEDLSSQTKYIFLEKDHYEMDEMIEVYAITYSGRKYTVKIYNEKGEEVLERELKGNKIAIDPSEIGSGKYTAKVICENYAFSAETEEVAFEVGCSHAYASKVTTPPTCEKEGVRTYTCAQCGDSYTETIPAEGHSFTDTTIEPTCTEPGYTLHRCGKCGEESRDGQVDALGHSYDDGTVSVEPTEDQNGTKVYTCKRCGETYTEEIQALGHEYGPGQVTKEPTCTEPGVRTYTCAGCGGTYTEEIPARGHSYESVKVEPTCTEKGYMSHTCTACGDSYEDDPIEAAGHKWDDGNVSKEASCIAEGEIEYACTACGATRREAIPLDGSRHTGRTVRKNQKEATEKEEGYTGDICCADCGAILEKGEATEKKPQPQAGECSHGTVEVRGSREATCVADGYTGDSYCKDCGAKLASGQAVKASEKHAWDGGKVTKAGVSQNGSIVKTCQECGVKSTTAIYAAKYIKLSKGVFTYNGKAQKPAVTLMDSKGRKLKNGTDYVLTYSGDCKNVGEYKVTAVFRGNYKGTHSSVFTIRPKSLGVSKITPKAKEFTVKWKKQTSQTTGYELDYSTTGKFSKKDTTKVLLKNTTTSKRVKGLKPGRKYYVRIRAYKTVKEGGESKKIYSAWSRTKTAVTRKK